MFNVKIILRSTFVISLISNRKYLKNGAWEEIIEENSESSILSYVYGNNMGGRATVASQICLFPNFWNSMYSKRNYFTIVS